MKINITVDVQEIFEAQNAEAFNNGINEDYEGGGYNLKSTIKAEIINGLKSAISKDCLSAVEVKSKKAIESVIDESVKKAQEVIAARALEFTNDWLEKKTVISDKWGDPVNELTISELIKQNFDNLLEKKVDSKGNFTDSYNANSTLVSFLTGSKVKQEVESRMEGFRKDIDSQIKAHIESGIKESVSNKFAEMVIQTARSDHKQLTSKS